ncbi:MAG: sodium:solute symporter family protein [Deltaproteobacteria bacterium]|jgi:SSS family solute:Na+ symporter|nr:sodium:solute symporter family protein [Deltaproteobacteria bacterium]
MDVISVSIVVMVILIICFILAGIWFQKMATTSDGFLLAGRGAPFWLMGSAYLGGYVGGASVSGYAGIGFKSGISAMWASLFVMSGCAAFTWIFARRANYFGRKYGAVTIADFVCARFGEKLRVPIALCAIMRPTFLTGMQFLAIAVASNVVFGLDKTTGIVMSALVILLYLITAGQYSALITQWFQSLLQSLGILLFALFTYKMLGNPTSVTQSMYQYLKPEMMNFWSQEFSVFSVWFLTFGLFYLVDPWIYMWAYIGKTPKVSSNAMLAVLGGSYYNVLPFLAGMCLALGAVTGHLVVPQGLSGDGMYVWFTKDFIPPVFAVIVLVGLLMTIVSCGSSFAMNGVTIFTKDIYQGVINKNATDKQVLFASRVSLILVTLIGIASALWLPILVPLWSLAQAIGISGLFATTMCAWFWKRSTTPGAYASTVCGGLVAFVWACLAWWKTGSPGGMVSVGGVPLHAAHVGLFVSIPLMFFVSLATKPEYEKAEITSYDALGREMAADTTVADKQTEPGFFGWLGADTPAWKLFWVVTGIVLALHYLLAFLFHIPAMGLSMVWLSFIVGVLMLVMLSYLGTKDVIDMVKATHKLGKTKNS